VVFYLVFVFSVKNYLIVRKRKRGILYLCFSFKSYLILMKRKEGDKNKGKEK